MKIKRMIYKTLICTLMLCIGVLPFFCVAAKSNVLSTILFTCDTRGYTEDLTYIERYKENTENCILVNCGNFTKGSAEASYSNARYSSGLMHEADYDLISLGTDDFTYGFRAIKRFSDYCKCSLLSGNANYSSADLFDKNTIIEAGNVKIGFFSLIDAKAKDYIPSSRADGYIFEEETAFANEQISALKDKCDKIICLASFSENNNEFTPEKLAKEVSGLDVLICSNTFSKINKTVDGTLILSADEKLGSMGKIDILNDGSVEAEVLPKFIFDENGKETEKTEGTYRSYGQSLVYNTAREKILEEFEKTLDDTIALNKTTIYGAEESEKISLLEETPLGDLFSDAMSIAGDKFKSSDNNYKDYYVVSAVNGSAIKNNIPSGNITLRNVFDSESTAEDVYFYEADANLLFDLIEKSVAEIKYNKQTDFVYNPTEYFLQISGFNVIIDPSAENGEKILRMFIIQGDNEIEVERNDNKKFILAVNESLAKGKAGYDNFIDMKPIYIGDFLVNYIRTAIASAVSEDYYISPGTESRISFKRIEELQPNGDAWATIDKKYEEYAACEPLVDGIENIDCSQVDENGEVRITLKTGAHGVSVNGEDIYVSTVSGLGIKKGSITPIVDYKLYYKTLDEAYKIDEDSYKKEAVKGYFDYLGRAFVQTKLTEEGEVVKATQDLFNVWDDFLENPDSFIAKEESDEEEDEDDYSYPNLEDFAYNGSFESSVFDNLPNASPIKSGAAASQKDTSSSAKISEKTTNTGDNFLVFLIVCAIFFTAAGSSILIYLIRTKKVKANDHD